MLEFPNGELPKLELEAPPPKAEFPFPIPAGFGLLFVSGWFLESSRTPAAFT